MQTLFKFGGGMGGLHTDVREGGRGVEPLYLPYGSSTGLLVNHDANKLIE